MATEEWDPTTYWAARNYRSSARLHLQHTLFQNTLGHLLEPEVEAAIAGVKNPKVADLACGNGIWLVDLESALAARGVTAPQLDGFDINPINFPAAAYLPEAVTLTQLDILATPLPAHLLGAYDVVHVRAFASSIQHADTAPLLAAARALLRPGGWLQWEESRADAHTVEAPSPELSRAACEGIVAVLNAGGRARGFEFGFLGELDRHLGARGFEDARLRATEVRRRDLKAWTEDYFMVWEELYVHFPTEAEAPQAPMTREKWVDLFSRAVKETEKGVVVHQGKIMSVVGRKAA
ncbi:hypothetical protein F5B20DRAFT_589931 [Whalleya microplaca]|nr:hypothetical protein F5B20DRAFT_589931 [Whalleya microplaca]